MEFRDFSIEILAKREDLFDIRAVSRASGELQATIKLKRSVEELLQAVQSSGLNVRGAGAERGHVGPAGNMAADPPTAVGQELFEVLFSSSELSRALAECMTEAKGADAGVRLKLTMNTKDSAVADLARLPWEMLHDESKYTYFSLRPDFPIVRYLEVPRPFEAQQFRPPLRILVVSSNPRNDLSLDKERNNLKEALGDNDHIALDFVDNATIQQVASKLAEAKADGRDFHVLHFMGHGDFHHGKGVLLLHKERGAGEELVGADAFNTAMQASGSIRLVFLNACNTAQSGGQTESDPFAGVATALVFEGVPAVVAMQRPVPDSAAIVLAKSFYSNIARGWPVDAAVSEGRRQMFLSDGTNLDWAIPVLFMRSPNGVLFDIADAPPVPDPPPVPPPVPPPGPPPVSPFAWKKWAPVAGIGLLAIAAAVFLIPKAFGPPAPGKVVLGSLPESIAMDAEIVAELELKDAKGGTITGDALKSYAVDWVASPPDIVKITRLDPTPHSKALTATIRGLTAPADKSRVTITASLTDFSLTDKRSVGVTVSDKAKDDFRDAYRAARAEFDTDQIDDATVAKTYNSLLSKSGWMVGYVDELSALNNDEKRGVGALGQTAKKLEEAAGAFAAAAQKASTGDFTLVEREQAWKDYTSNWANVRKASPALTHAKKELDGIKAARETSAWVDKLMTCRDGDGSCSRPQDVFMKDDKVRFSVEWKSPPNMRGRDKLDFEWVSVGAAGAIASVDSTLHTDAETGREPLRNWWGKFTATSSGPHEIRVKNGKGVLVYRQAVTVK